MFKRYTIEDHHFEELCIIFHKSLTECEIKTGVAELRIGLFNIRQMQTMTASYGIWFRDQFVLCINDEPIHDFSISVHENSFITENMAKIVIKCLIKVHGEYAKITPDFNEFGSQAESIKFINDIMSKSHDHFSNDEMVSMSELLYGKENKKQLKSLG